MFLHMYEGSGEDSTIKTTGLLVGKKKNLKEVPEPRISGRSSSHFFFFFFFFLGGGGGGGGGGAITLTAVILYFSMAPIDKF